VILSAVGQKRTSVPDNSGQPLDHFRRHRWRSKQTHA